MPDKTILTIELDDRDAQMLYHTGFAGTLVRDQAERFEKLELDEDRATWKDGAVMWCSSAADALLLRAYERANGYRAEIDWDLAHGGDPGLGWVVLSTRPLR